MWSIKQFLVIALCALLCVPSVLAQGQQPGTKDKNGASQEVTIIIQQQQVRFIAQKAGEEMRLQVFDQSGELVFDSGAVEAAEVNWPLQSSNGSGETLKSGLYGYTLSTKEAGAAEARLRRGHFIVDRAKDRDGTDKLWVTSQNESGVGADLTVAKDEAATVAGAVIGNSEDRTGGQRTEVAGRDIAGRQIEAEAQSQTKTAKEATMAVAAGTVGQIAKFTSTIDVGNSVMVEQNANIGIGATAPKHRLSIAGGPLWTTNQWNGAIELQHGGAIGWQTNGVGQRAGLGHSNGGTYFFRTNSDPGTVGSPAVYDMVINDAGSVGIGTTNPGSKLAVQATGYGLTQTGGTVTLGTFVTTAAGGSASFGTRSNHPLNFFTNDGLPRMTIDINGNVGIGASPTTKLYVLSTTGGVPAIYAESATSRAIWGKSTSSRGVFGESDSNVGVWGVSSSGTGVIGNSTTGSGVDGSSASINGYGGHFINTAAGGTALKVDGKASVGVLEITAGSDFAENFDVSAEDRAGSSPVSEIQPGLVVTIDPANPGKLSLSHRAYDRRVAGVISGAGGVKPGMTMGQEQTLANGKYPVALSGRVYVWVDATRGAIRPGDLLTTSATAGHAMKAGSPAKAQGAIIGKAMTGLKSGKGLVLVLVTLQ